MDPLLLEYFYFYLNDDKELLCKNFYEIETIKFDW